MQGDIPLIKKGKNQYVYNVPCVFDIEATSFYENNEKRCTMYAWVFGINGKCIRGRTWEEFLTAMDSVCEFYQLHTNKRLIIFVHNLAYEFQWFKKYFEWEKIFSLDNRKPLYAITKTGLEFRCSYLQSGYSLEKLGENLTKYKVEKKVGDLDYNLIRHSNSVLTEKEWGYILNDGLVVMAYIQEEIERLGSITKLPLTKTGYVRELCRERCLKGADRWNYNKMIRSQVLTPNTYLQLKRTYMGGFTHANVNYVGKVIDNVHSFDFTSSYPAVMVSEKFPISSPKPVNIKDEKMFIEYLETFCCMFDCTFYNLTAKADYESYISFSRCLEAEHYILNNGRILEASKVKVSLTEQDFFIMRDMYDFDYIEIENFYIFYNDYLPRDLVMTILELYKDKTELKGVEEKLVEYMVAKGMINSVYGMCVTDPCRDEYKYENDVWSVSKADIPTMLEKYNKNPQRALYYAWGVWVTAFARRNLFSGIVEFKNDYVYSDTDSIKVLNIDNHLEYIKSYNKTITEKINRCLSRYGIPKSMACPKTIKGKEKPLGVWDYEGMYSRFKTLGAKRYMTEQNGEIGITIAGVSKTSGVEYLKHTYKDNTSIFKAFTENLHFPSHYDKDGVDGNGSGKLCHTYIDTYMGGELIDYMGVKGYYSEASGVHMENTDYSLSIAEEFKQLIFGKQGAHLI